MWDDDWTNTDTWIVLIAFLAMIILGGYATVLHQPILDRPTPRPVYWTPDIGDLHVREPSRRPHFDRD